MRLPPRLAGDARLRRLLGELPPHQWARRRRYRRLHHRRVDGLRMARDPRGAAANRPQAHSCDGGFGGQRPRARAEHGLARRQRRAPSCRAPRSWATRWSRSTRASSWRSAARPRGAAGSTRRPRARSPCATLSSLQARGRRLRRRSSRSAAPWRARTTSLGSGSAGCCRRTCSAATTTRRRGIAAVAGAAPRRVAASRAHHGREQ